LKPPVQTFDVTPMVRFRVRGTEYQVYKVHEILAEIARERAGSGHLFTTSLGTSGPVNGGRGEASKQWACSFYTAATLVQRVRDALLSLGLAEEA
jgi:hypothetical protein